MLQIIVPACEMYDEETNSFINTKETVLKLEHSLLSISKWESKWCKPFLAKNKQDVRTQEELLSYVKCMTLNTVSEDVYKALTRDNMQAINEYVGSPMTATTINYRGSQGINREIVTSELIYYWMIAYGIPFECEKWHLNRLIKLIQVCEAKNNPKKMSRSELLAQNRALNRARRKSLNTRG